MNIAGSTIKFPFSADSPRGTIETTSNREEIIVQAIEDILETRKFERKMLPDYGISDYIFDVQGFGFAARIAFELEQQIINYVPLVRFVKVVAGLDEQHRSVLNLEYTETSAIQSPRNLVFPVWRYLPNAD